MALLQISVQEKGSLDDDSGSNEDIVNNEIYHDFAISISFNCNKRLNTFNMVAGLEFKLVRQKHEIVLFFITYSDIASITSSW